MGKYPVISSENLNTKSGFYPVLQNRYIPHNGCIFHFYGFLKKKKKKCCTRIPIFSGTRESQEEQAAEAPEEFHQLVLIQTLTKCPSLIRQNLIRRLTASKTNLKIQLRSVCLAQITQISCLLNYYQKNYHKFTSHNLQIHKRNLRFKKSNEDANNSDAKTNSGNANTIS